MTKTTGGPYRTAGPVSLEYDALVARGAIVADPAQRVAADFLDTIVAGLSSGGPGLLARLLGKRRAPIRGLYLYGEVGRGKTMLMDLFFAAVPTEKKRRIHFHAFMDEMHRGIAAFRATPHGQHASADPVEAVAAPLADGLEVLCLDEFHVHDITNAMLLDRLFEKLFARGVVLVATSNVPPQRLYENGLNRQLFLPFIALLERHTRVAALPAARDYRRDKFVGEDVFVVGEDDAAREKLEKLWLRLTGGEAGRPTRVESIGRQIPVPRAALGAAWFAFSDLCEKPLGSRDFVRIAQSFDTIVIDGVPGFDGTRSDASKRFILLIDSLYDRSVKLAARFLVPIEQLGQDDRTAFEFERTLSRLIEMQSADYLAAPHRTPALESEASGA